RYGINVSISSVPLDANLQRLKELRVLLTENVFIKRMLQRQRANWGSEYYFGSATNLAVTRSSIQLYINSGIPFVLHSGGKQLGIQGNKRMFICSPATHLQADAMIV